MDFVDVSQKRGIMFRHSCIIPSGSSDLPKTTNYSQSNAHLVSKPPNRPLICGVTIEKNHSNATLQAWSPQSCYV